MLPDYHVEEYLNLVLAIINQARVDLTSKVTTHQLSAIWFLSPEGGVWDYVNMFQDIDHEDGVETWWSRRESERRLHSNVTTSLS